MVMLTKHTDPQCGVGGTTTLLIGATLPPAGYA